MTRTPAVEEPGEGGPLALIDGLATTHPISTL
jgi:hypothetical protein